ncbi:TetR/AcrR family transcriptional regulator [Actibacterium sp. 188UL27-1]|uniref:TetR/AcrR family transcriptional regulator n=1 Tax=Actibacterium sp. 188UL27-1 TaxID=2786961 RepID=UPI00195C2AC7|nr:TetR/AcrR family transcriptional regulator [Actibacterium sp. 188UL27-1]MBM7069858.1 TetR/AcrR family transcriptional regulator [Actibacterium sp. 188UL27-1]
MNAPTPEIKRGRKFDQVLEGARGVFLQDGFEGASVDVIAREAGVSKATLYSYFPDKRLLFMEVATQECRRQADSALQEIDMSLPPRVVLRAAATRMLKLFLSELGRGVFRICVAESDRFPELGQEFYDSGPRLVRETMVTYFRQAIDRGELRIDDLDLAADQFAELCKADMFPRMIMGVSTDFSEAEIDRVITGAVDLFLARYEREHND